MDIDVRRIVSAMFFRGILHACMSCWLPQRLSAAVYPRLGLGIRVEGFSRTKGVLTPHIHVNKPYTLSPKPQIVKQLLSLLQKPLGSLAGTRLGAPKTAEV